MNDAADLFVVQNQHPRKPIRHLHQQATDCITPFNEIPNTERILRLRRIVHP
jgi:hypothetical protein